MKLNEKIILCRKKCGISQEALGDMIGVSRQAVSKWETGDALPEVTKLKALANVFGVTVDWLLDEENSAEKETDNATSNGGLNENYNVREKTDEMKTEQSTLGIHSTGSGSADRASLFIKHYGWIGGILLMLYGAYRTASGIISIITAFGTVSVFNASGMLAGSISVVLISAINLGIGIALIVAGAYIIKSYKPSNGKERKKISVSGIVLTVLGILMLIVGVVLLFKPIGALEIFNVYSRTPAFSIVIFVIAAVLIIIGAHKIKKAKSNN